jgi:hypothetical protein
MDRMPNTPDIHRELSSVQVMIRFLFRMVILCMFAAIGRQGFGKTLASLLVLSAFYCVFSTAMRREAPFGRVLTHVDEAAAYAMLALLVSWAT